MVINLLKYMNIKIYRKNYKFFFEKKGITKWIQYDYSREMNK